MTENTGKSINTGSKTLVHMQAEQMAQRMFTDMMASAGVDHRRMAQEVLFFLPRSFTDAYELMWYQGLGAKGTDGGSDERGRFNASKAELGRASGKGLKGGASRRRSYKKYWVVRDEAALELKDKVDKRLRGLAREIERDLAGVEKSGKGRARTACGGCGRILGEGWNFCSSCGSRID